ncbi:MAG: PAS domain S-box protein [Acidobacteriota bacterium]
MSDDDACEGEAARLRRQAEEEARAGTARGSGEDDVLLPEQQSRLLHELRVHQIELEMQNDELRRAQEQLDAARERYFDLYDLAPVGYLTTSEEGLIEESNCTAATLLGVARSSLPGQPVARFVLPADQDIYYTHRRALRETGSPQVCELRLLRPGGSPLWVRLEASVVQGGGGARMCRVVVSDIDERQRAAAALKASEEKYRTVVETANEAIIVAQDGRLKFVNPMACALLGYSEHELQSALFVDLIAPEDREMVVDRHQRRLAGATLQGRYSFRVLPKGGGVRWVEISAAVIEWEGNRATLNFLSDLTERKLAEEALARSQAQLLQAQKMEAVGRLAGGVAHDFNNILQAMLSMATVLRLKAGSPELAKIVAEIEVLIRRGAGLTQQLLLYSRHHVAEKKLLNLGELVDGMGVLLRRLLPENIRLAIDYKPEDLWVDGDAGQLQQVLMNLVVNAKEAMASGGTLTVRVGRVGDEAVLEVVDTGHGMDEATRLHLFEPFFTTKGFGTGLGLSVVHGIVEQHRGRVEVETSSGKGSVFRVALPAIAPPDATAGASSGDPEPFCGHGERVLVVEDEEEARKGLADLLTILGYVVTAVGSGEETEALPDEPRPDLLLADLMLPGIDGVALTTDLHERWPGLKVVLMSGYTEDEDVRRGADRGGMPFLQKPFDMAALARVLRAAFAEHPRDDVAPR